MKIVSDFDGVWTDQAEEARWIGAHFVRSLAQAALASSAEVEHDLELFRRRIQQRPGDYGWAPEGRITAFVDEDPLLETAALALYIEHSGDARARRWQAAVRASGAQQAIEFSNRCFLEAMQRFCTEREPLLVAGARSVLEELRALEVELVVVSNSPPEKIAHWFAHGGVPVGGPGALLRVRGSAAKWALGSDESLLLAGRRIFVDRPRYRALLEEEQADLVIGDVFSLDLALPARLRATRALGAPRTLVLREHAHTPAWVRSTCADGAIDALVAGVADLPRLVQS